jgi:phospho-N-acetylmuramoyl-pentapeptide-transferase
VGTLVVGRLVIPALVRAQRVASPSRYEDCPPLLAYQETKRGTPTMGGVFVLLVGMGVAALAGGLTHREGWLVIGAATGLGAIGLTDDGLKFRSPESRGLGVLPKLLMALAIGAVVGLATEPAPSIPGWAWVVFAMVVVAGCAHAVNLTDGMDGLAAGCVAIALGVIGLWVILHEPADRTVIIWCASLAGACAGFLWFNSFPASIFLGDVGSLGLGAALGTISLVTHRALWLVVIGGVFVAEALSVMLQVASYKWRNKQRIFRVAPLHHHVHLGGVSEPKVTVRFWIVAMLLAMLALTVMELT